MKDGRSRDGRRGGRRAPKRGGGRPCAVNASEAPRGPTRARERERERTDRDSLKRSVGMPPTRNGRGPTTTTTLGRADVAQPTSCAPARAPPREKRRAHHQELQKRERESVSSSCRGVGRASARAGRQTARARASIKITRSCPHSHITAAPADPREKMGLIGGGRDTETTKNHTPKEGAGGAAASRRSTCLARALSLSLSRA